MRNKTGDLVGYISHDCKPDIVATTKSWLGQHDDAVRVELCPKGYNLLDRTREKCRGVGLPCCIMTPSAFIKSTRETGPHMSFLSG